MISMNANETNSPLSGVYANMLCKFDRSTPRRRAIGITIPSLRYSTLYVFRRLDNQVHVSTTESDYLFCACESRITAHTTKKSTAGTASSPNPTQIDLQINAVTKSSRRTGARVWSGVNVNVIICIIVYV